MKLREVIAAAWARASRLKSPPDMQLFEPATDRWTDRILALTPLRLLLWVVIGTWVWQGILTDPFRLADWMDDHQFYAWEASDRLTLLRYGELPLWNPFWCGGTPELAAPEDPFLGPDFLLRIVFGVAHGRRLALMLLLIMGFEGTFRLARKLDASSTGALFAALTYGTCNLFINFIHDGWVNFLGFELIPWVILSFLCGLTSWRWRLVGGFFFAWLTLSAGTYPTPFALLTLGYMTIAVSVRAFFAQKNAAEDGDGSSRDWLRPWITSASIGVVAFLLTCGKLVSTFIFLRQFARVFTPMESHTLVEMVGPFWANYWLVVVLALAAVILGDRRGGILLGGALFALALAMGDRGEWSPYRLLKKLPIFGQLRFPDRYMVLVLFFTSLAAARGITRLEDAVVSGVTRAWRRIAAYRKLASEPPKALVWLAVGLGTLLSYRLLRPEVEELLTKVRIRPGMIYVLEPPRAYEAPFRQARGNRRDAHVFTTANLGSMNCVAGNPVPESPLLRADLPAEEYPVDPAVATVKRLAWTPNSITLEVDAKAATTVRINQNWDRHWRTDVGTVRSEDKLLVVDVPAGKHVVHLRYRDWLITFGLLVSLATLLAIVAILLKPVKDFAVAEVRRFRDLPFWPDEGDPVAGGERPTSPEGDEKTEAPPTPADPEGGEEAEEPAAPEGDEKAE